MKKYAIKILCVITVLSLITARGYSENGRKIIDFNSDWLFEQDESGNPVPQNGKTVSFLISGPGKLVGIGKNTNVTTADGEAVILVQSTGETGIITVTAQCESLKKGELFITVENR
jgi:hypothetical protein